MPEELEAPVIETPPPKEESILNAPNGNFNPPQDGDIRKELPKDLDKAIVNFEDFQKIIRDQDPNNVEKVEVKKDETKVDDTKTKNAVGKQDEQAKIEPKVEGTTQIREGEQKKEVVDEKVEYGEAANFFPKMAKEAKEFLKARVKEINTLQATVKDLKTKVEQKVSGELPQSYLEHPNAYILDPKFGQAVENRQSLQGELDYWRQQLVAIRNADKWTLRQLDAQGKITESEQEAGPKADEFVSFQINKALRMLEQQDQTIGQIQGSFKQRYEADRNNMKALEAKYYPMYEGDKGKDNPYIKTFTELLAANGQKDNILTSAFSKLYALTMEQTDYIKANEAKWKAAETTAKTVVAAGPNSGDLNGAGGEKKVIDINNKPFSFSEFQEQKNA